MAWSIPLARTALSLTALLLAAGCGLRERARHLLGADERSHAAVRIGSREYTQADLDRFFDIRLSDFREASTVDQAKSKLLETFIEEKLLLTQADLRKVEANPEAVKSMLEKIASGERDAGAGVSPRDADLERRVSESLKVQRYLNEHLLNQVSVSEQECEDYYRQHLADYVRNDVVRVREILVEDAAQAGKIVAALRAGRNKNFAELARIYSKAPSASDGGEMGMFQRGELPEQFDKAIFPLQPGNVSKVVRTSYGYHIFLVEEKILAHQQRYYEVREEIAGKLVLDRQRQLLEKELDTLVRNSAVAIHQDRLDFKYVGARFGVNSQ